MAGGSSRVYDLSAARPDGWFDEVLKQSRDFERACQIIGRSTLGLGLVAGARIASITPSQHSQNLTIVEFSIGSDATIESVVSRPATALTKSGWSAGPMGALR